MNKRYYINSAVVVALMALFRFIPPFGSMTAMGMTILGIFLGALWGWISCDMIWPSVLALVLLGFSGYTANVTEALTMTISNGTVQLILWLLVFSALLTTTGVSKYFVNRLVNSKFCKGHPWRLSLFICLSTWICAAFGAGFAAILICWQLVYTICAQVGYTKADRWPKMMVCAIIFFNALGALSLPFQAGVVANFGFLAKASEGAYSGYNYVQYLMFSMLLCVCTMTIYFLFCRCLLYTSLPADPVPECRYLRGGFPVSHRWGAAGTGGSKCQVRQPAGSPQKRDADRADGDPGFGVHRPVRAWHPGSGGACRFAGCGESPAFAKGAGLRVSPGN